VEEELLEVRKKGRLSASRPVDCKSFQSEAPFLAPRLMLSCSVSAFDSL